MKQAFRSRHAFSKTNLVTINKGGRMYDELKCSICGMTGRMYVISEYVTVADKYSDDLVINCLEPMVDNFKGKLIQVTQCQAVGKPFANLLTNTYHLVVTPPKGYCNRSDGVWVQGVGKPVKLLNNEFNFIEIKRRKFNQKTKKS